MCKECEAIYIAMMRLTIGELKRLIKEVLNEEADVPGRWRASDGEGISRKDAERFGFGGFPFPLDEEEGVEEGHEENSKSIKVMNHQGDGVEFNQMGRRQKC